MPRSLISRPQYLVDHSGKGMGWQLYLPRLPADLQLELFVSMIKDASRAFDHLSELAARRIVK